MIKEILFYILSLLIPQKENSYFKNHMIDTKYIPQFIYWIDDGNVLLSSYGFTEIYNTNSRERNSINTCDSCIYGYDWGLFSCRYEHRDINSIDEFSSTIYQYNSNGELILSKDIFETVIPVICKKDYIILRTGDPMLEQKMYVLDIKRDEFKEYVKPERRKYIDGLEDRYITKSISRNKEKIIILDEYYRLWVYIEGANE